MKNEAKKSATVATTETVKTATKKSTPKATKAKEVETPETVTETTTKTIATKAQLFKAIEAGKFDEIVTLNPIDFMTKDEKSKLNLETEAQQLKGLLHVKDSGFKLDSSVLALAMFYEITDIRLAIKKRIFEDAKRQNEDGFYHMFETLTDMESFILLKDGMTKLYNSVMKFRHRKQFIPKGKPMIVEINNKSYIVDENIAKFAKYNIADTKEQIEMLMEHALPLNSDEALKF